MLKLDARFPLRRLTGRLLAALTLAVPAGAQTLDVNGYCFVERIATDYLNVYGELVNTQRFPVRAEGRLLVYDAAGRLIKERNGLSVSTLNVGEKLPVYTTTPIQGAMSKCILRYTFSPADAAPRARARDATFAYQESVGIRSVRVSANVTNPNAFALRSGIVNVTGYDASGRVVMVGQHSFFNRLEPGQSVPVSFTAQNVAAKPARYVVLVEAVRAR